MLTRDNGPPQPVRWIDKSTVPGVGDLAPPVRIGKGGLFGNTSDLVVSPQHRMVYQARTRC